MRKSTISVVLFCAAAALLAQPASAAEANPAPASAKPAVKPSEPSADAVVAKGKGVEIKRSQLDEAIQSFRANSAAQGRDIPPDQASMIAPAVLDRLIQSQVLVSKATDAEKSKAKADASQQLQEARTNAPSEEAFNAQLKEMGMTKDQVLQAMAEQATAEAVLLRELKIKVTDDDLRKFYNDTNNATKFEQPERVRASHILLMTQDPQTNQELSADAKAAKRKTMEGLLKRAKAGEDFGKLAKEFSEDPGSKDTGGEYTFPRGQMVPEFESTAFGLKTNEVSEIVTTQYGYHIIKLSEHMAAQKVAFDKVAPRIQSYLTQQELAKLAPDYLAKIKKDAAVEILDAKLKAQEEPGPKVSGK